MTLKEYKLYALFEERRKSAGNHNSSKGKSCLLCEKRVFNLGEFQAREDSSRFEYSVSFGECSIDVGDVADSEGDSVKIERV
jgi:hypothetical protein